MRRSKYVGVALIGLLVVAAISLAAGSGRKPAKEQQGTVSLRQISVSEMMDFLRKFPEMLSSYSASERNDTGYLEQAFRFTEVTAAPLEHAFPAARFYRGRDLAVADASSLYLIAVAGDKRYAMPEEFNRLLIDNGLKVTDKNVAELAEAFVVAAIAKESRSLPEVTFLGATRTNLKADLPTDDAAILKVKTGEQTEEWHFSVLRGQFEGAARVNGKGLITDFPSVIVESLPGQGQLNPTPDVPKHQK